MEDLKMNINTVFELSMTLDTRAFQKAMTRALTKNEMVKEEEQYIDLSLADKGLVVEYLDRQYKKKIKLLINASVMFGCGEVSPERLIRKLEKRIGESLGMAYQLEDFGMSGLILVADIDVHSRNHVAAYLKVMRRVGKVKGFSPAAYERLEGVDNFCLEGNSNGIVFAMYDLEGMCKKHMGRDAEGILRVEVHLIKSKAVRAYLGCGDTREQIAKGVQKSREVFLSVFGRVIPFGDFCQKRKAEDIIRANVPDYKMRRKMLRLVALIPEKKSLLLAQKAMNCRDVDRIMEEFARINLSPVTISKRQEEKCLENFYSFLLD
jgi:hypothetical protein